MTRVLLVWPGSTGAASGNFGVPQLVGLASYVRARTGCEVHVRDLVAERALGPLSLERLFSGDDGAGYDVVGISVYSSFDWLLSEELARRARAVSPDAVIVAGGYHASARPAEIVERSSPFDVCIVGEGEIPLTRVVESVRGGAPIRGEILGSEPIEDLDSLPETDWSVLDRYRGVARKVATQAQLYLSRGCPFDCAFCMERAKRDVSWRAFSVERAVEEVARLHAWLDLRGWTLYVADALFGMKVSWRRRFLAELARRRLPVDKLWLLIRVDLVEDEDLALFAEANCGLGFGLESGDPAQLAIIRKAGRLEGYLQRMEDIAAWALERDVPWGANVIVGHPGETAASIERSARYLERLFLGPRATTGFLAVDPFRLYPGSPIDAERPAWEARHGTRFHHPSWWHEGDPDFLAEWVDPSAELGYLERERLQHRLFAPIAARIEGRFAYEGPAGDYFLRAIRDQVALAGNRFHVLSRYAAWTSWTGRRDEARRFVRSDADLPDLARAARTAALTSVAASAQLSESAPVLAALAEIPRERFVPPDAIEDSVRDVAIAIDDGGRSTISAMHAYARTFALAGIGAGMRVLDLGSGSGYGAAILARIVGGTGEVRAVEIDPGLAASSRDELAGVASVTCGDALDPSHWGADLDAVVAGFALEALPLDLVARLRPGAVLIAPVMHEGGQRLARVVAGAPPTIEWHEEVRYVSGMRAAVARQAPRTTHRLPVVA